jgi:5-methylthioadenosine/S-adenosylhomocysteine deaminase
MALVIEGRLLPLADDASSAEGTFHGRVWIGDDGLIAAVTRGRGAPGSRTDKARRAPAGFEDVAVVDVGGALVIPGLIDLHNHLAYNALPLWTEPTRTVAFPHHDSWPNAPSYAPSVTWPAYAYLTAAPRELLAYVEAKALVGGTTSIQGSPPKNRPHDNWLVRNVEDETWGTGEPNLIYASTLPLKPAMLAERANRMRAGSTFIYHCAEGQPGSLAAREFAAATAAGCLQERFVAVHCNAVEPAAFKRWTRTGAVVWSPLSNLWLYGTTTDVPAVLRSGVAVCLGSDWGPSGSKNVLGELKVARIVADGFGWDLSDADLVRMATCVPGDVLARGWGRQTGRLQPGAVGDLTVIGAAARAEPFAAVVRSTERDVRLVVVGGRARYGTPEMMAAAKATPVTTVQVDGRSRALALTDPDDPATAWSWSDVVARLEEVRRDPRTAIDRGVAEMVAFTGAFDDPGAPLRLALDMPTGAGPVGGLPKDLTEIQIPPLDGLVHDKVFVDSVVGRGFHNGLLDRLADYYT